MAQFVFGPTPQVKIGRQGLSHGTGGGSGGAVTDPIVSSINADGWSFTASGTPPTFAPDVSPQFAYVTRAGYSAAGAVTSFVEPVVLTGRLRQAAPNDASLTADQGVLSDYIYSTDSVIGKTNNSTEVSPKPVANWALADRQTVNNSVRLEVVAFHRDGIACVEFAMTDGVTTVTQKVSAQSILGHAGDKNPVVGYACDLDISPLANGQITTTPTKVYPRVGGAASVLNCADSATEHLFSPRTYTKSASGPLYIYAISGGNDATGVLSSTAETAKATPCATLAGAFTRARAQNGTVLDNVVIRLGAGTWELLANNASGTYNTAAECIIERDPDELLTAVTYRFGGNFNTRLIYGRWRNLQLARTAGSIGLLATRAVLENCTLDNNSAGAAILSAGTVYIQGLTITNPASQLFGAGANVVNCLLRGISATGLSMEDRLVLGCSMSGASLAASYLTTGVTRTQSGCIVGFNKFNAIGGAAPWWVIAASADVSGYAMVQNVIEWSSISVNAAVRASGDSAVGNITHLIDWHNTVAGFGAAGRNNYLYDESAGTTRRVHKLCSWIGSIPVQINNKTDKWVHYTNANADAPNRTGAWPVTMGVGCRGLLSQFAPASTNEVQTYPGLNASIGASATVRNDPLFTNYQAATSGPTAGAGGGDYSLQSGSPAIGRTKASPLAFDLAGVARNTTASASGAYERLA